MEVILLQQHGNGPAESGDTRMIESTQKELASSIDAAAARAEMMGSTPSTGKQNWFLAKLIIENDDAPTAQDFLLNFSSSLTKKAASAMISEYLN